MICGIISLYERVIGRFRCLGGLSEEISSTIGVKQGCPLSPTLVGLYIDDIFEFIDRGGGGGASLQGLLVALMLYADDVVLMADSQAELQHHIDASKDFSLRGGYQ